MTKLLHHLSDLPRVVGLYKNPIAYYANKIGLIGPDRLIRLDLRNELKFTLHGGNSDINSLNEIFNSPLYGEVVSSIQPSWSVVDVGANIGVVSVAIAKRLTSGRVYAFEPMPEVHELLLENVRQNALDGRIVAFQLCVAESKSRRQLHFKPHHWGGAHLPNNGDPDERAIDVDCVGLGDIFELTGLDRIDLLKMDCEGAEQEILAGGRRDDFRRIDRILVEYHEPLVSKQTIKAILEENGFRLAESDNPLALFAERP